LFKENKITKDQATGISDPICRITRKICRKYLKKV